MNDKYNFGTPNEDVLAKSFNEAKKDKNFVKLIEKLDMSEEKLMNYTSKLEKTTCELKNCAGCKGLAFCKNSIEGFVYYPIKQGEHLQFSQIACKYTKQALEKETSRCTYYEIPEALRNASMSEVDISDGKRVQTIKWLKNFYDTYKDNPKQKGLYLTGSFGSGKTYLICAMLNELSKKNVDIIVVYYPELLRSLKESFDKEDFPDRMNKLKHTSILFLDDIGAENLTAWSRDEILGTILQYRMDASLPTFFTSNLNLEELETHLSSAKGSVDKVKARRIIERIRQLTDELTLVSKNRRN